MAEQDTTPAQAPAPTARDLAAAALDKAIAAAKQAYDSITVTTDTEDGPVKTSIAPGDERVCGIRGLLENIVGWLKAAKG